MNLQELRKNMYSKAIEQRDVAKIEKMITGIEKGKINKENFYDEIRKFTQKIYSDSSLSRWQCLSECMYNLI